jgi:hypothetical protein
MLSATDWDDIARAYRIVLEGMAKRLDGKLWSVYRVGSIIRVDIKSVTE